MTSTHSLTSQAALTASWVNWDAVGSGADWATGIVAAIALIFAAKASSAARATNQAQQETLDLQRQQLQHQQEQLQRQQEQFTHQQEQLERAQASKVTFHIGESDQGGTQGLKYTRPRAAYILNASDSPAYSLALVKTFGDKVVLHSADHLLPTGPQPAIWELGFSVLSSNAELHFKDAAGLCWIREAAGALRRPSEEETESLTALIAQARHAK